MTQDEFAKQYLNTEILILAEYTNDTTVLCFQGMPGLPGMKVSSHLTMSNNTGTPRLPAG